MRQYYRVDRRDDGSAKATKVGDQDFTKVAGDTDDDGDAPKPKRKRKPTWLRNIKLNEISFVTDPANQHARITIAKHRDADPDATSTKPTAPKRDGKSEKVDTLKVVLKSDPPDDASKSGQRGMDAFRLIVDGMVASGMSHIAAYRAARRTRPDVYALMQSETRPDNFGKADEDRRERIGRARSAFEQAVNEIQARGDCDRLTAMSKARHEHSDVVAALNAA